MRLLESVESQTKLSEKLSSVPDVARYDRKDEPQGFTLAYNLSHLEESFSRFLTEHLPKLTERSASPEEIEDALFDIEEELLHVHYHLRASPYFGYLYEPDEEDAEEPTAREEPPT